MSHPREILNRIQRQRAQPRPGQDARVPAPAPAGGLSPAAPPVSSAPSIPPDPPAARTPQAPPAPSVPPLQPVPRPVGGHALYRELMRSHDRMGTRHLKG